MNRKSMKSKEEAEAQGATALGPGDFPIGSLESRAAARLRLQKVGSPDCICFPELEIPFFSYPIQEQIAAAVKCPLHGDRFKPPFHLYVADWRRKKEAIFMQYRSPEYKKAWFASFPPELWPAVEEEIDGKLMLRLKDGTMLDPYGTGAK